MRRLVICVALASVVIASCSGSSTEDSSETSTTQAIAVPTASASPDSTTSSAPSTTPVAEEQPESIDALVAANEPSGVGAVLVGAFEPGHESSAASGIDGDGQLVTPDTAWETASLVKMIVATSVLQLVDQGFVELDSPVNSYVDFSVDESIKVRDVLSHRSGISNMTNQLSSCPATSTIEAMKERAASATSPLSETEYSNTNYILLGYLIDQVTGQDVGDYAQDNIFSPLGMTSTYWWESQEGPPVYWKRPISDPGSVSPFTCPDLDETVGTEGLTFVSTLHDLDAFLQGLFGGVLMSAESLEEMLPTPSVEDGLGIWSETDDERAVTLYGHFGSRSGFSTIAYYDLENSRSIIAFSHDPTEAEELMWQAWDIAEKQSE
jgi:D-alanyl-D-alanine carboxypeptidase